MLSVLSKKDYRYTTSITGLSGLLDELGWLPLFERRNHSHKNDFSQDVE